MKKVNKRTIGRDIDALCQARLQSRLSMLEYDVMKYKLATDALNIAMWNIDFLNDDPLSPVNKIEWSKEIRPMLGISDDEILPDSITAFCEFLHHDDVSKVLSAFTAHFNDYTEKTPYNVECRIKLKNGEYRYFQTSGKALRNDVGIPIMMAGTFVNIHEMKTILLENELQLAKLNLMTKAAKMGLWDMEIAQSDPLNPKTPVMWSDDIRHMLGFTDEEDFPNLLTSWSNRLHPEDKEKPLDFFEKHITDKLGKTPYDAEYRLLTKNGEYRYFHASGETVRDINGIPIYAAGALKDITETKRQEKILTERTVFLDKLNRAKAKFLQDMSHEMKTPLTVIANGIDFAGRQIEKGKLSEASKALDTTRDEIQRLGRMVSGMIDMASMDEMAKNRKRVDFAALLTCSLESFRIALEQKNINLNTKIVPYLPDVFVEGDKFIQVMSNLLSNAADYTQNGQITLEVDFDNDYITVCLSDTGEGIEPYFLRNVFNRGVSGRGGTGYGLYICKTIVEAHGGTIDIESLPGEGTTVTFTVPVYSGQEAGHKS